MIKKAAACVCLLAVLTAMLTGCFGGSKVQEPDDLANIRSAVNAVYVLKKEDSRFYPLTQMYNIYGDSILKSTLHGEKAVFFMNEEEMSGIPVLEPDDLLIVKSESNLPEMLPFFSVEDIGWTVGCVFARTSSPNIFSIASEGDTVKKGSTAETDMASKLSDPSSVRISTIGGQAVSENLMTEYNTLKDLEKGAGYEVVMYEGTSQKTAHVTADTDLMVSVPKNIYAIKNTRYTDQGFAILTLAAGTPSGYYYINDPASGTTGGLFYYQAPEDAGEGDDGGIKPEDLYNTEEGSRILEEEQEEQAAEE